MTFSLLKTTFFSKFLSFIILTMVLGAFTNQSCFVMPNQYASVAPGVWRAVLQLSPNTISPNKKGEPLPEKVNLKFEEATEGELPFLFEVKYSNETSFTIDIINGEERIPVAADEIKVGKNKETGKDTILINFPIFGSYIRAIYRERVMEGEWVIPAKSTSIPFIAHYGQNHRFTTLKKTPKANLTGKWECDFDLNSEKPYKAIGELQQNGNILRGTFRTETGDYRFLDGEVQEDKFYLSCFDGSHAFLFEGKIRPDGTLDGLFRSGKTGQEVWSGKKNEAFELRDANTLTKAKDETAPISFSFPNAEGKTISLSDYGKKVKIIQIMGTWCPNCRDETHFLKEYLKTSTNDQLAVIALSFERNPSVANTQVATYKQKMGVPYEILIAGTSTNKDEAAKTLPWLNQVIAYPTMIMVDKNNKIRHIHTGFDGPATSKYASFKKEFEDTVKKMLSE